MSNIATRSGWDRLRYTVIFEGLLIVTLAGALAFITDRDPADTGTLAVLLSVKAMLINLFYNYVFDRIDVRYGRIPTQRSLKGRAVHAIGFEIILSLTSLPIVMWWLGFTWWQAVLLDLGMMSVVVVYTFLFTLGYDRWFPVIQPAAARR